jgi:putative spermidine/putrescine transport system permease protein
VRRRRTRLARVIRAGGFAAVWLARALAVLLLVVPIGLVMFLSCGADAVTVIPPTGYSLRWYANILKQPEFLPAFVTSLQVAALVTVIAVVLGTLAAQALARGAVPGRRLLATALYSPIMVPLIVTGSALLLFLGRIGMRVSFWNIVIGHLIITFPYVLRTVSVTLARYDVTVDEAAMSLGARPWQVFFRVTLPLIRPGVFAGALFAFIMSFDDFTVTIFLIGADTRTLPVAIYQYMEWNLDPTVSAVSVVLIVMAVAITLAVERVMGLGRLVGARG